MIYVLTAHHGSDKWLDIQLEHLDRHLPKPWCVWLSVDFGLDRRLDSGVVSRHSSRIHHRQKIDILAHGTRTHHHKKLDSLAYDVQAHVGDPGDALLFLDSDAFPVADVAPLVEQLPKRKLIAVCRSVEFGVGDKDLPHPCFALVDADWWVETGGTWNIRHMGSWWRRARRGLDWLRLEKTAGTPRQPYFFNVYGDVAYHHGAGSRRSVVLRLEKRMNEKQRTAALEENTKLSAAVFENIKAGRGFWEGL